MKKGKTITKVMYTEVENNCSICKGPKMKDNKGMQKKNKEKGISKTTKIIEGKLLKDDKERTRKTRRDSIITFSKIFI